MVMSDFRVGDKVRVSTIYAKRYRDKHGAGIVMKIGRKFLWVKWEGTEGYKSHLPEDLDRTGGRRLEPYKERSPETSIRNGG